MRHYICSTHPSKVSPTEAIGAIPLSPLLLAQSSESVVLCTVSFGYPVLATLRSLVLTPLLALYTCISLCSGRHESYKSYCKYIMYSIVLGARTIRSPQYYVCALVGPPAPCTGIMVDGWDSCAGGLLQTLHRSPSSKTNYAAILRQVESVLCH